MVIVNPHHRRATLYAWLSLCNACSVYDAELIGSNPSAVAHGRDAAADGGDSDIGSLDAGRLDAASEDDAGSAREPMITTALVHCGDGRITGDETCDIAIASGMPGACPSACPELAPCNRRELRSSGCHAECVLLPAQCMGGDGCCPASCTDQNDSDCSSRCGDGIIQSESGETCESESSTPCKSSVAQCDDQDPCTVDELVGSAKNCNTLCTHEKQTTPKNDDGCCVTGADANSDNDCKPICGNKIRETGEDCDGTTGCSTSCKLRLQAGQIACLDQLGNSGDDCAKCSCTNCAASYLACRADADCNAVLECARAKNCWGTACYCGDSLLCGAPNGSCKAAIEKAGATTDPATIALLLNDVTNPLGKSYAADTCRYQQCPVICR